MGLTREHYLCNNLEGTYVNYLWLMNRDKSIKDGDDEGVCPRGIWRFINKEYTVRASVGTQTTVL